MTMELLEARLHSLERRNARLKIAVMLVAVLAVGANLVSMSENLWAGLPEPFWADAPQLPVQDTLRANRIEVVDTDGKVLAVLGKLTAPEILNHTTIGLQLFTNDQRALQLAVSNSNDDGSLSTGGLQVFNPKDAKRLFSAGVTYITEGMGLTPQIRLEQREDMFRSTMDPYGLNVFVKLAEYELSSEAAISLQADKDHSAELILGGITKPFKLRAIAEPGKPRLVLEKGEGKNRKIKTYGLAP